MVQVAIFIETRPEFTSMLSHRMVVLAPPVNTWVVSTPPCVFLFQYLRRQDCRSVILWWLHVGDLEGLLHVGNSEGLLRAANLERLLSTDILECHHLGVTVILIVTVVISAISLASASISAASSTISASVIASVSSLIVASVIISVPSSIVTSVVTLVSASIVVAVDSSCSQL